MKKINNHYPTIECHYELKCKFLMQLKLQLLCNPKRNNREWFDWVRIHFEEDIGIGIVFLFLSIHYHMSVDESLKKEETFFLCRSLKRYEEN